LHECALAHESSAPGGAEFNPFSNPPPGM